MNINTYQPSSLRCSLCPGSLQDYDDAVVRCESQQKRVENRRAKVCATFLLFSIFI